MTAEEARELTQKALDNKLAQQWPEILSIIRATAERGQTIAHYGIVDEEIAAKLRRLGYEVVIHNDSFSSYTHISW